MSITEFLDVTKSFPESEKMPALFVGHGSPMNGIEDNEYARAWEKLSESLPRPTAILSISAHWYTEGTHVHVAPNPKTIHDFWGFPEELYQITYDAPGSPAFAKGTKELIESTDVLEDTDWGIDHGTWIVLHRMYPQADIPVFQLSIDLSKPPQFHYELGKELSALRKKGVLVMGSGNIVHNLGRVNFSEDAEPFDWAVEFDAFSKECIEEGEHQKLIDYTELGHEAQLSIPTPDHYLPLLYILGIKDDRDTVSFPVEGISHSSISMRSILLS